MTLLCCLSTATLVKDSSEVCLFVVNKGRNRYSSCRRQRSAGFFYQEASAQLWDNTGTLKEDLKLEMRHCNFYSSSCFGRLVVSEGQGRKNQLEVVYMVEAYVQQ